MLNTTPLVTIPNHLYNEQHRLQIIDQENWKLLPMKYDRNPFTPWTVEVLLMGKDDHPLQATSEQDLAAAHLECFYRAAWRDGKECEQFSITAQNHDDLFLQIQIFSHNDIRTYCWLPHTIEIHATAQQITVIPLYKVIRDGKARPGNYPYKVETDYFPQIEMKILRSPYR